MVLENLEPQIVWQIFENVIANTPRRSQHEDKIRNKIKNWVKEWAESKKIDLKLLEDSVGNILIKKPGIKGMDRCPSILLQAHLDMVCETDRPEGFDFDNLGIPLRILDNKQWIDAEGTTLGADDGIGVALAMALLLDDNSITKHGPIEVLLTVNEEDGFTGATNLDVKALDIKSKYMINLDGGPLGEIVIGSVCGRRTYFRKNFRWLKKDSKKDLLFLELSVSGLLSGHSGGDIHLPRANAIKLIIRFLSAINQEIELYISNWNGGTKGNVIPSKSKVVFAINKKDQAIFETLIGKHISIYYEYYKSEIANIPKLEPNLKIKWQKAEPEDFLSLEDSKNIIFTSNSIPHGVIRTSPFYENFVETSVNFATIKTENYEIEFQLYPRSIIRTELDHFCHSMGHLGELSDWKVTYRPVLPEWIPKPDSEFLEYSKKQYEKILGKAVNVKVVHGGLETGMISKKIRGIEMISLGPTVIDNHTPNERLKISDVGILYEVLIKILEDISNL